MFKQTSYCKNSDRITRRNPSFLLGKREKERRHYYTWNFRTLIESHYSFRLDPSQNVWTSLSASHFTRHHAVLGENFFRSKDRRKEFNTPAKIGLTNGITKVGEKTHLFANGLACIRFNRSWLSLKANSTKIDQEGEIPLDLSTNHIQ